MRLYLVKEDDKKNLIKGLVDKNVNILSLDKETPTLEEIIYKIKKE
jgi:hypothetical protein